MTVKLVEIFSQKQANPFYSENNVFKFGLYFKDTLNTDCDIGLRIILTDDATQVLQDLRRFVDQLALALEQHQNHTNKELK